MDLFFEPLTPISFLQRSGEVFADRIGVIDGERRFSYGEFYERCRRLAGALSAMGARDGERVAVLAPNTHMMLEAHYGVPMASAVLVTLNTRLNTVELSGIIEHSGANYLLYDSAFKEKAVEIADRLKTARGIRLTTIEAGSDNRTNRTSQYEDLLASSQRVETLPEVDERGLLSINYTSGTTGEPKGVMYHYRGAYLQALSLVAHTKLDESSVMLWTLPMFHCNGWCFTWAVTAAGATHVCMRRPDPWEAWRLIRSEGVTHLCGAPTVLSSLANDSNAAKQDRMLKVFTGGAPPSPSLLEQLSSLGIEVTHSYGLTETFGPILICQWRPEWDDLPVAEQARLKARQGVAHLAAVPPRVIDREGNDVPADGKSIGEIVVRGNVVMRGYYRNHEATVKAAPDGWFRTGDLVVVHPDGYIEIRDRSKDIIISGGENIASIEVEQILASHPAVLEAAVVAAPDVHWGEIPVAYVTLRPGEHVSEEDLIAYARQRMAHFKVPKRVVFGDLPKNSTGKILKHELRQRLWQALQ